MGRGRGRPKFKGHSRHFTSREELEEERKKDEEKARKRAERGYDSPTDSEESEESESESGEEDNDSKKNKGVEGLIEISNPNHNRKGQVKVQNVEGQSSQLTRRQKEELARQHYQKMQQECKTDQAQKDLARLEIIRKRREEQAAAAEAGAPGSAKK